jgi:hypothetical protein
MEISGDLHVPAALFLEKEPRAPFNGGLGWPQSGYGHCGVEKNLLRIEPQFFGHPAYSLVTIPRYVWYYRLYKDTGYQS